MKSKELINLIESHDMTREYKIDYGNDLVFFKCSKCYNWKKHTEFSRDNKPSLIIPFRTDCKSCQTRYITNYYRKNESERMIKNQKDAERKRIKRGLNND